MRRIILASTLVLASCAPRPQQASAPEPVPQQPLPVQHGQLTGLNPSELVSRLGSPALQIREGSSLKLQFRAAQCVLDAYLYPSAGGQMSVTYVDARTPTGASADQAACIASLSNPI